jgi:hypothetical protein
MWNSYRTMAGKTLGKKALEDQGEDVRILLRWIL